MKKTIITLFACAVAGSLLAATTIPRVQTSSFKTSQARVINNALATIETELNNIEAIQTSITGTNDSTVTQTGALVKQAVVVVSTDVIVDGSSGNGWGTVQVGTFPEGQISILGVVATNVTMVGDGGDLAASGAGGDFAFGSTATSDATLTGTDVNLCPSTSVDPLQTAVSAILASGTVLDGTSTAVPIHMNWIVDDADVTGASTNAVTATLTITYVNLGDK